VQRQPDPLQPDDQHELLTAPGDGHDQAGDAAGGERPDPEQVEPEHRLGDPALDEAERDEQDQAARDQADHGGIGPAHAVAVIRLDALGDADQDGAEADGERDVAPPVDAGAVPLSGLLEPQVGPQRAEHPDRHVDPEHQAPVDRRQQAPGDQPDKLPGQAGDLIGAEREAAPLGRERVGQDRGRVRHQHGPADSLEHPPAD
jgi:hypothetical protein